MKTKNAIKSGRAFNGAHRDAGIIVHSVPPLPEKCGGPWFGKALCGTEPGIRGNGWHVVDSPVTCPKCLGKINKVPVKKYVDPNGYKYSAIQYNGENKDDVLKFGKGRIKDEFGVLSIVQDYRQTIKKGEFVLRRSSGTRLYRATYFDMTSLYMEEKDYYKFLKKENE